MSSLRRKLEENPARPKFLVTEQNVGYRLRTE
jgi:DNA-binding response OmpR family regulator